MNIKIYNFMMLGTSTFASKYQANPTYGYYSVDFSMAELQS